ncbi:RHS repeat-associated core domain-containing protein [Chryseobacterium sp. NEB161]|nr:RHS repeat-associated core domain-containing protein [Chryseobacterium sp. NEB161]
MLLVNFWIFGQKTLNGYTAPQTVVDGSSVRLLPGFHANSNDGSYTGINSQFVAKIGNPATETVPPSSSIGNTDANLNENYIYTRSYLVPVTESNSNAPQTQSITYYDGLGRPTQNISVKSTPQGNDLVKPIIYDDFGRPYLDILPIPISTKNSDFHYNLDKNSGSSFYGTNAYSEKKLENSPLDRVLEQFGPGLDWRRNNKRIVYDYLSNENNEILKFVTSTPTPWSENVTHSTLSLAPGYYYPKSTLYKNKVTDEDDNISYEFKNGQGQTLLIRKMLTSTISADTYYVYNEYDQLAFVITPKASEKINASLSAADLNETEELLSELSYQYRYDGRNRLVEKKLPGKGWEYMVYDQQDRLVLTQDENLGSNTNNFGTKGWLFTKYDIFGRIIYTGFFPNSAKRVSMQTALDSMQQNSWNNEERTTSATVTLQGMPLYYDNKGFPTGNKILLSVNYYDTYPDGSPENPGFIINQQVLTQDSQNSNISTKSLPVASYIKNIEDNNWTKNYNWYDTKARLIGTHSINYLGGYTKTESLLDFTGLPQQVNTYHKRLNIDSETIIKEKFTYDRQNRLLKHTHQVNNRAEELLAVNSYDEVGHLIKKQVGNNLQELNYSYNIRGWMTGINDLKSISNDLFAYKINYNTLDIPNNITKPYLPDQNLEVKIKYNGNISQVEWLIVDPTESFPQQKSYGYSYDSLDRLRAGFYYTKNSGDYLFTEENNEILKYDLNGNIIDLKRFSYSIGTTSSLIDDLTYQYTGNRLTSIEDLSSDYNGYEGGGNEIDYDANGNMTSMLDKGINNIAYNYLNLPNLMTMGTGRTAASTTYTYRADGVKLKKLYSYNIGAIVSKTTDYLDGFQYLKSPGISLVGKEADSDINNLESAMEKEAYQREENIIDDKGPPVISNNSVLQFVPTTEGFYSFIENRYIYQYKDHLGNTRVSFARNSAGLPEITDKNNYYPFGLNLLENNSQAYFGQGSYKNYKYNEQELQETGTYAMDWRHYMPDIGRFTGMDALSDVYENQSPYHFGLNNPANYSDPTGLYSRDSQGNISTSNQDEIHALMGYFDGGGKVGGLDNFISGNSTFG